MKYVQEEKMKSYFYCLVINKIQIQYRRERRPTSYAMLLCGTL